MSDKERKKEVPGYVVKQARTQDVEIEMLHPRKEREKKDEEQ